ncbi:MAG: hypothetical protein ACR2IF_06265 [Terriglobales bacterium]
MANRLVQQIESNSDRLAEVVLMKLEASPDATSFKSVPREDFRQRVYEVYDHLGEWLLNKKEGDIARRYLEIGIQRRKQGVLLSELIYAIILVRDGIWQFLRQEAKRSDIPAEMEILDHLGEFFYRAIYYSAKGYEKGSTRKA